jgi:5-methylcytosine-specific restriction endonuclease McrA
MAEFAELTKQDLEALYKDHATAGIASMFGVSAETVRKRLVKLGIPRRVRGGRRDFDPPADELRALYQTMSMAEIAAKYGVGETVVWKRLKDHGIKLRGYEEGGHRLKPGRIFSEDHRRKISRSMRGKVGPLNRNWKGGRATKSLQLRGSIEYREWRNAALSLRGDKCQECGVANGWTCECCGTHIVLHVHHLESFARVPERRFDPANSEVLCPKCHRRRHRRKPRELLETP